MMKAGIFLFAATATLQIPAVLPGQAADYRFTRPMQAGQVLGISNIDGPVTVRRASGGTAEVLVTKRVIRGNGDLVKAVLEETENGIKVCTLYLSRADEPRDGCEHRHHDGRYREPLQVEMRYEVRLPAGVELAAATVDGDIIADDLGASARLATVDGNVRVTGRAPERITTVDGDIDMTIDGPLPDDLRISTVDGSVRIALAEGRGFTVHATTLDGSLQSDFALTTSGRWSSRAMRGTVGDGRSTIRISTVDGDVELRRR